MGIGSFIIGGVLGSAVTWFWLNKKKGNQILPAVLPNVAADIVNGINPFDRGATGGYVDPYGRMQYSSANPFTMQDTNSLSMPLHARLGVRIA